MTLAATGGAIGAVTSLLRERLLARLVAALAVIDDVTVGRPEPPGGLAARRRLNLFLYEVQFDGHLRNQPLDEGQPAPLWLVLRYLLTPFDAAGESDTTAAHDILGHGIRALQDLNFFSLTGLAAGTVAALEDNPDLLKLTFEEAPVDLQSRLMQGSEERYRCSVSFQVRPVMIAADGPPATSLLVGVDYTTAPLTIIGTHGIRTAVLPSLGPSLTALRPARFDLGDTVEVLGTDLHLEGLSVRLGPAAIPVTAQRPDRLSFLVPPGLGAGTILSAGSHLLTVVQTTPLGRTRSSNALVGELLPRLDAVVTANRVLTDFADPASDVVGDLDLQGSLLGTADDEVFVTLVRAGGGTGLFDTFLPPAANQQLLRFVGITLPQGAYRVMLRVNGQQARNSPLFPWGP